ncbi:MAG TPA: hypothetical protein VK132_09965 [Gemmatimonadales bacterium]|nr:hypothetical protein [Gemmatimonadales bacterium]
MPKAHPILPEARIVPTLVVPLSRTKGSSSALPSILWVLLEIAAALALITLLQRRRAIPALSRLYHGAEADAGGAVAVTQPQPKVARPRRKAEADTDKPVEVTPPLRHVVAVSKVPRPHRKAEADMEAPVLPTRTRRRLPDVALPKIDPPHPEAEAEADADPEAAVYARSYLEWLERQ